MKNPIKYLLFFAVIMGLISCGFSIPPESLARLTGIRSMAVMDDGTIYATTSENYILRIEQLLGQMTSITIVAGTGVEGHRNGKGSHAMFNDPKAIVALDNSSLLVADKGNHVIRKISISNGAHGYDYVVEDYAGIAEQSGGTDGAPGTAKMYLPYGLTVASNGDVYFTEEHRVRKIDAQSKEISTIAGNDKEANVDGDGTVAAFALPISLVITSDDSLLYVVQQSSSYPAIRKIELNNNNKVSTLKAKNFTGDSDETRSLDIPASIAIDTDDNVYILNSYDTALDQSRNYIMRVSDTDMRNNFTTVNPAQWSVNPYDDAYVEGGVVLREKDDFTIYGSRSIAIDSKGNLYSTIEGVANIFYHTPTLTDPDTKFVLAKKMYTELNEGDNNM